MIDDIRKIFISEAIGQIEMVESLLRTTSVVGSDDILLIHRAMHNIKGSAPMFGFQHVADIAHAVEGTYKRMMSNNTYNLSQMVLAQTTHAAEVIRKCLSSPDAPGDDVLKEKNELIYYFNRLQ